MMIHRVQRYCKVIHGIMRAFVYDNDKRQRFIYINGLLDIQSATGVGPYYGTSGTVTIGGAVVYGGLGVPYLTGLMDHLTVSTAC